MSSQFRYLPLTFNKGCLLGYSCGKCLYDWVRASMLAVRRERRCRQGDVQSSGTTATFDTAGDALVLQALANSKWVVIKEYGITLT